MLQAILHGKEVLVIGATGRVGHLLGPDLPSSAKLTSTKRDHSGRYLPINLPLDVEKLPADSDVVIVLAAMTSIRQADAQPQVALETNVAATRALIDHFRNTNSSCRIVFTSSVRTTAVDSMYCWSKVATEAICASSDGIKITVARLGSVMKGAGSIEGILKSLLDTRSPGFVTSSTEYYQASFSVPHTLSIALDDDTRGGSIVTPLLTPVPIPFVAGYLAGYERARRDINLSGWSPRYDVVPPLSSVIPSWWLPFTRLAKTTVDGVDGKTLYFLITNFKEVIDEEETAQLRRKLKREYDSPDFGQFASYLEAEGVFNSMERRS